MASDSITLCAVGDICLGDSLISLGFGTRSMIARHGPNFIFDGVRDRLRSHDIVFGNLESVLSDRGVDPAEPRTRYLRGAPEGIESVCDGGFHILNVANNHILQYGRQACEETLEAVRGRDIVPVGLRGDGEQCCVPEVLERDGMRIGFLAYSFEWEQYYEGEVLYARATADQISQQVRALRDEVDYVIVSIHWGLEYMLEPSPEMREIGRAVIDAGADVVLGHHPHVLQGMEHRGDGIIFYSLGNFVFDKAWWPVCRKTCIASLTLPRDRSAGLGVEVIPVRINGRHQPRLSEGRQLQSDEAFWAKVCRRLERWPAGSEAQYAREKKMKLAVMAATKIAHILWNAPRYEAGVFSHLFKHKILRISAPKLPKTASEEPAAE